ncbi:cytochrome P450 94A1-like [Pyrus ussuriensis x Pyrus communis]|uniref:Cytochrome P450 94A1-like n=1 Tax=Pyrus ussuriensis x Pyrus communis TaxID=2448454 RepID=A0A5N5FUL7_9ROSA|nr:cytochrome P450 94A1-like [Pyrus ussuriensis x Pyrus communis]
MSHTSTPNPFPPFSLLHSLYRLLIPNPRSSSLPSLLCAHPSLYKNHHHRLQWFTDLLRTSPSNTFTLYHSLGCHWVVTANPTVGQHILKTNFPNYQKGEASRTTFADLFGNDIFNVDGDNWKFQHQVSSHKFNTKSLCKFSSTSQDILQRFTFDNICQIAFGYDLDYLLPSLLEAKFAVVFDDAMQISSKGFELPYLVWKLKKALGIGSEKRLRAVVSEIREFANTIVKEKKQDLNEAKALESVDLLSRFLSSGHSDEKFITGIVISFTLAARETTSAALTWFFLLLSQNLRVEQEILKEINNTVSSELAVEGGYDEVKEMVYTHAALYESIRLYSPVPIDRKKVTNNEILSDS